MKNTWSFNFVHIESSNSQVGSFNYAIDKMVFLDEFVPAKKDSVKSVLDYDISISQLRWWFW